MIHFMEEENQQGNIATTTENPTQSSSDYSPTFSEVAQTVADSSQQVAVPSQTISDDSPNQSSKFFFPKKNRDPRYSLTSKQVLVMFAESGVKRTPRGIQRYCQDRKLDAYLDEVDRVYYITPESAYQLLDYLKEKERPKIEVPTTERSDAYRTVAASTQPFAESSPTVERNETKSSRPESTNEEVKILKEEIDKLKFEKIVAEKVNDELRKQINQDRDSFTNKVTKLARLAENFKTRLLMIGSPQESRGEANRAIDLESIEASVMETPDPFNDKYNYAEGKEKP